MPIHHTVRSSIALALLILGGTALAADAPPAPPAPPAVGDIAKDFTLKSLDGSPVQLSVLLKNGPVVLVMLRGWVGYQCPVCTQQVGSLAAHAKEITANGASVVLVYPGAADHLHEHAGEFAKGKNLPDKFYFVEDPDLSFVNSYGLRWDAPGENAYPATFVIGTDGKVLFKKVSDSHMGRATWSEIAAALPAKP